MRAAAGAGIAPPSSGTIDSGAFASPRGADIGLVAGCAAARGGAARTGAGAGVVGSAGAGEDDALAVAGPT